MFLLPTTSVRIGPPFCHQLISCQVSFTLQTIRKFSVNKNLIQRMNCVDCHLHHHRHRQMWVEVMIGGGGNAWGQKFITSPPKPNTYHRYKPFCLKDHILLVKKKSFPGNITFWTEMAILTLIEISYIFILAGLGPKWFVLQSWTQRQSCRAHKIGQFCHQDRPFIPLCSKVRDLAVIAFLLAQKW